MILSVCNEPEFLEIVVILKQVINIIKIGAPLVLIVMLMVDVVKAVTAGNSDNISKSMKQMPSRLLAAAMIFLVPTVIDLVLNVVDEQIDYATCITNANYDTISLLYVDRADTYVAQAEASLKKVDLISARSFVNLLTDEELKESYNARLDKVEEIIKSRNKEEFLEPTPKSKFENSAGNIEENTKYPYYNQGDSRWRSIKLPNGGTYDTNGCGCGYAALAMVLASLNNDPTITPKTVVPYVINYSASKCAIADVTLYDSHIKSEYGVTPTVLFYRNTSLSHEQRKAKIVESLKAKKPVVVLVPGHYIALFSMGGDKILALDPARVQYNGVYTIDSLFDKFYNYVNRCNNGIGCGFMYAVSYSK